MGIKLFLFPLPRTLFLKTLTQLRCNLSILADSNNVNHSNNAPSQNLFLHFVTTRFNMSSAAAAKMLKCKPSLGRLQTLDNVEEVVSMLHRFGCNDDQIAYMIRTQPSLGRLQTLDNVEEVVSMFHRIDIPKENSKYKHIVSRVALSRIEVLEARVHNLQRFGLSPEQVVRAESSVLSMSEENIKKKMDFMLNHMEFSVEFVAKHPRLLSTSLDQVMKPRFLVLQKIMAMNGAVKFNLTRLCTILRMTEAKFVDQIIQQHRESATLLTVYKNAIVDVSKEV